MGRYLMSVVGANDGRIFVQGGMGNSGQTQARARARIITHARTHAHTHQNTMKHTLSKTH